ncbi:DUF4190 domain-containing protein [Streptomyces sp. V4-01]|uniref:DUF4190 domain-containing protein n=1 Tax=Actinacidiphila polyblastidii TaxID=3110430 RepID=A0ABU7PDS1_9ACTN|nr:DUF4190 domain-containing protein [Streptomyces sp. V4-01]
MDIPPPPPPPPSADDAPPPGPAPADAQPTMPAVPAPRAEPPAEPRDPFAPPPPGGAAGPPPVPMPPPQPGGPYGALPAYPQSPYGTGTGTGSGPYGGPPPGGPYPYGGPAGYGYPPPPPGWYGGYQQNLGTNGLAIASLVVSIAAFCLPVVAAVLGIFGLRQIRRTGQGGRGLAIAGIVINSVATVLVAVFVVLGLVGALDEGNTDVQDIRVGQCFNTVGSSLSDYGGDGRRSTSVDVVSCGDEHDAEAYAVFTLDESLGDTYPGVDRISEISNDKCADYADDYLGDQTLGDDMDIYFYMPPKSGWNRGDRAVTCFFGSSGGKVSGSVKSGAGTDSDPGMGV